MKENSRKIKEIELGQCGKQIMWGGVCGKQIMWGGVCGQTEIIKEENKEKETIDKIMDCFQEGTIVHLHRFFDSNIYAAEYPHLIFKQA